MVNVPQTKDRRTSVDTVFGTLYEEISSLKLLPGDKISEAEIAAQFGISRQPVRDAFSRLEGMDLLLIRPQRATEVKRFSLREITKSRFVRAAVEAKILGQAARECDKIDAATLEACIERQRNVVETKDYEAFGLLDYDFHRTLCDIAKADFIFEVLSSEKAKVDRLCRLSIAKEDRMPELLIDHETIAEMIMLGDAEGAVRVGMLHLSRLDATIAAVSASNSRYFDP